MAISTEKKASAKVLLEKGVIHRAIAQSLGIGVASVSRIRKEFDIPASNVVGQPKKISTLLGRKILRNFNTGEYVNAVDASKKLEAEGTSVSPQTVRNFLLSSGFKSGLKKNVLPLTPARRKARLAFAKKYEHFTEDDWERYVFSDETKINRLGSDGKQWTWKMDGRPAQPHNVHMVYKHGGGSIFLWSCISFKGPGFIVKIDGGLDAALYCNILSDDFLKTLDDYGLKKEDIVFQQDNDPKHTSRLARKWFEENGVEVMDWPAYSPDLNPIENAWSYLKQQLYAYDTEPKGITELWERVQHIWYNSITKEYCQKLIRTMPQRLKAVIKAKGGPTKW